jgi:nucleotide-binding universal stress UspA family protein
MFQHIVLLLDDAALTERALSLAARIAQGGGGHLTLLRLLPPPTDQGVGKRASSSLESAEERARTAVMADMEALLQRDHLAESKVALQVGMGTDVPALVAAAQAMQADLLIVARAARTGLARWKREPDLPLIVRQAPAPVLVLPERAWLPEPGMPVRLLVPLDGSRLAETALAPAASLAAALAAPESGGVHLVRVISNLAQQRQAAAYLRVIAHRLRRSRLAQALSSISWSVVCHLDVAEALSWVAEQGEDVERVRSWSAAREIPTSFERCDLLALTTHGRHGLERWTLGSVTERLIRWEQRALLIMPPPGPKEEVAPTAGAITEAELHTWLGIPRGGNGSTSSLASDPARKNFL